MIWAMIANLDHHEAGKACKSESAQKRRAQGRRLLGVSRLDCETTHTDTPAPTLSKPLRGPSVFAWVGPMKMRRLASWWFRFVISGRFLGKFLKRPNA